MNENIVGLIPAAGRGIRLGLPYPKELYPIIRDNKYKPISQYIVETFINAGIQHIVFVINDRKHQLIGYFGDGSRFGCNFSYVVQEYQNENISSKSPGLAHALNSANHLIKDQYVCFGMPDTIVKPATAIKELLNHLDTNPDLLLGLFPIKRPEKSAAVVTDSDQNVIKIIDKPKFTDIRFGWACMVWNPTFTNHLSHCVSEQNIRDFAEIMNQGIKLGFKVKGVPIKNGDYTDLGTYDDIIELEKDYRA